MVGCVIPRTVPARRVKSALAGRAGADDRGVVRASTHPTACYGSLRLAFRNWLYE